MDNLIATEQSPEIEAKIAKETARITLRHKICNRVADEGSLLGCTSDISHLLLAELSVFVNKLSQAQSLSEMRASTDSLKSVIGDIESKIASEEVVFPYQVKGKLASIEEALDRATEVSTLLK